jgi:hypothetical protein
MLAEVELTPNRLAHLEPRPQPPVGGALLVGVLLGDVSPRTVARLKPKEPR